ncbi:MAG: DNA polymerase III subunit delta [Bacteroidaceae bacterium]|nr:DNA polymerase III subunit delta [Bacteroidaceae bacterium]
MAAFSKKQQGPTAETIMRDVSAGQIAPIYYLMGAESYYIDKLESFLVSKLLQPEERDFNLITILGSDVEIDNLMAMARNYPMGAQYMVIVVKEAQNVENLERLEFYLKQPQPQTVLIFSHKNGTLDGRTKITGLIRKTGVVFESPKLYDNQIPTFVSQYVREKGAVITSEAAQIMADSIGADLSRVASEADKLILSLPEENKKIDRDMVLSNIGMSKEFNVYELLDALGQKNALKVNLIQKYFDSNAKAYPIQRTLPLIFRYFSSLMLAYYAPDRTPRGIATWLGQSEWQVQKNVIPAMQHYNATKVMHIISAIRRTDARSKGVDNPFTSPADLMRELFAFILA